MKKVEHLVVCLGGGVRDDGRVPAHVQARVEKGVEICGADDKAAMLFSSSFTLNKPPALNADNMVYSEASAMARYACSIGYQGRSFCEQQSHDTIGSAYFIFSDFVSFLRPYTMTVITSDFHVDRATAIFIHMSGLFSFQQDINFIGIKSDSFLSRKKKEQISLESYMKMWRPVDNLIDFRRLLFETHSNYNYNYSSDIVVEEILQSY